MSNHHWAILIDNNSHKNDLITKLLSGNPPEEFKTLQGLQGALFSKLTLERYITEEDRHDIKIITVDTKQSLRSMSSGEQKKALLRHILNADPNFIVLDNPFDNLDTASQEDLAKTLQKKSDQTITIQICSRKSDFLPFITNYAYLNENRIIFYGNRNTLPNLEVALTFKNNIPPPLHPINYNGHVLIELKNVTIRYGEKTILKHIDWKINKGEFWQLIGKNGSGKTTILSMLTGENHKGYGQELFLFGKKKGSGESIWDIRKKIGYFTPTMVDNFSGRHSIQNMLISGLNDSIGLYVKPTEAQLRVSKAWLQLIDMWTIKDTYFQDLSIGQQRLIMIVRAMIKHPLVLILDEPTTGLDDSSAKLLIALVNKIGKESDTATIFVSHRHEKGLKPDFVYELQKTDSGSIGLVK